MTAETQHSFRSANQACFTVFFTLSGLVDGMVG